MKNYALLLLFLPLSLLCSIPGSEKEHVDDESIFGSPKSTHSWSSDSSNPSDNTFLMAVFTGNEENVEQWAPLVRFRDIELKGQSIVGWLEEQISTLEASDEDMCITYSFDWGEYVLANSKNKCQIIEKYKNILRLLRDTH